MRRLAVLAVSGSLHAFAARAEVPQVVTDIPPVQSLAAMAMEGLGAPALLVPPGASPHDFALRPSDARALAEADLLILNGGGLAPGAERAADDLAPGAVRLDLMALGATHRLELREGAALEEGHGDEGHGEEHAHEGSDPHGWLDPTNGKAWLAAIAAALAEADPDNAGRYAANAERGAARIAAAAAAASEALKPVAGMPFLVAHDSLGYFEAAFGLRAAAALAASDAAAPGPRRVEAARAALEASGAACIFVEAGEPARLAERVAEGTGAAIAAIDPLGAGIEPGPALYPELLTALAGDIASCLGGG